MNNVIALSTGTGPISDSNWYLWHLTQLWD